jgi:hypothetical protein
MLVNGPAQQLNCEDQTHDHQKNKAFSVHGICPLSADHSSVDG